MYSLCQHAVYNLSPHKCEPPQPYNKPNIAVVTCKLTDSSLKGQLKCSMYQLIYAALEVTFQGAVVGSP